MLKCSFLLKGSPGMSDFKVMKQRFYAFSGQGEHMNKVTSQCIPELGPIPVGEYYIVDRVSGGRMNWLAELKGKDEWFSLYRKDGLIDDFTFCDRVKRGQFRMHPNGRGGSKGCITFERKADFDYVRRLLLAFGKQNIVVGGVELECYGVVNVHA